MAGKLYGIGVGPGDPELITLKAVRIIKECDIIAVPCENPKESTAYLIALKAVPELMEKRIEGLNMPMIKDKRELNKNYEAVAEKVCSWISEGKKVGILTLGDATIYSTYLYVHELVKALEYDTEIINGIPSFCAAAAKLDMGLSERSKQLHIIPASYNVDDAIKLSGTKVFMKAGSAFAQVKRKLKEAGISASMVENCGMIGEKVYKDLDEADNAGYYSIIICRQENDNE